MMSNNYGSRLDAGAGNDIIVAGRSWDVLTGGAGSDIFQFDNLPWNNTRITDFTVGSDMLDLRTLFTAANYQGTNPVADGYLSFASDGAGGTKVYLRSRRRGNRQSVAVPGDHARQRITLRSAHADRLVLPLNPPTHH